MVCPKCGGKLHTEDVRNNPETNEVYRKRRCYICDYVFFTMEFEVERDKNFLDTFTKCCRKSKKENKNVYC